MTNTPDGELEHLRARVLELEHALARLREEHRIEREHDRLRHQEHALGLIVETEAAHDKNRLLTKRINRLREQAEQLKTSAKRQRDARTELEQVYTSRTWRLGRALTRPTRVRRP